MSISEAAKKASRDIAETCYAEYNARVPSFEACIQSAIDAETAKLREELIAARHTLDWTVAERDELLGAMKKVELKLIDTVGTKESVRGMNEATKIARDAIAKVEGKQTQ